jgi:hypothetical protein
LWDGRAKLKARIALPDESALFAEANNNGQPSDGLMLVYLVELDGEEPRRSGRLSASPNLISKARTLQHATISDSPARSLEPHLLAVSNSFEKG